MSTFYLATYDSPLGQMTLAATDQGLCRLHFETSVACEDGENPDIRLVSTWLDDYFSGKARPFDGRLSLSGTAFEHRVWEELLLIPNGVTATYSGLAERLQTPSARAVGTAVGKNPIAIIVPCHRVIGKDGSLTGYAGGLERKQWLLDHEGVRLRQASLF